MPGRASPRTSRRASSGALLRHPGFAIRGPEKGTGLGLALSGSFACYYAGDLILDESDNSGTCFIVPLPRVAVADTVVLPTLGVSLGLNVLLLRLLLLLILVIVIDGESDVREAVVAQLGSIGCRSCTPRRPRKPSVSSTCPSTTRPSCSAILTDIRMPGTSGAELYAFVHARDPEQARGFVCAPGDFADEDIDR